MTFNLFSSSFVSYWPCPLQNDYQNPVSFMPGTIPDAAQLGLFHSPLQPTPSSSTAHSIAEKPLQNVAAFLNLSMYFPQTLGLDRSMDGCSYKVVRLTGVAGFGDFDDYPDSSYSSQLSANTLCHSQGAARCCQEQ
jgi:hypothetical protein